MSNLELLTLNNMVNSSRAMFERRQRILREARKIIREHGLEALNMRDLGKLADVSTRTIYNAFGSKETVIALAIHSYFETFIQHVRFDENAGTFDGALTRQITSTLRDVDFRQYMKAIVGLYFSTTVHRDIREVLIDLATRSWIPWLSRVHALRQLEAGIELNGLIIDLSNIQYAKIHEWQIGLMDDETFVKQTLLSVLMLLAGATRGNARTEARKGLLTINEEPAFLDRMLSDARQRIAEIPPRQPIAPPKPLAKPSSANKRPKKATRSNN